MKNALAIKAFTQNSFAVLAITA